MISKELAQIILNKVHDVIPHPIIICGAKGEVYAASIRERIGNIHDISKQILDGRLNESVITPEMQEEYSRQGKDVRNGIHSPIIVQGEKIATVGITGDPSAVRPYSNMIRLMIELVYEEALVREKIVKTHGEINESIASLPPLPRKFTPARKRLPFQMKQATPSRTRSPIFWLRSRTIWR
jgi:sugar diacid utilization regulator